MRENMDNFKKRRARLRYLISVNQGLVLWVDSVRLDVNSIVVLANPAAMLSLGEALSLLRPVALGPYLDKCISSMKDYVNMTQSKQKTFRIFKNKAESGRPPELPFELDSRTVFISLCQVLVTVYQSIEELTRDGFSTHEEVLYFKLHEMINNHIVKIGFKSLDAQAQNLSHQDRQLLKGC